jgi:hypothetical protein
VRFEEQARRETKKAAVAPIEGQPTSGLKPWREVVTPHPDVASGRYQQAEFAADLGQAYRNEGADEYRNPTEFFRRTFLTDGLQHLLSGALQRLSSTGGDPVVELQTNFGGGKTHSMLALYHLFSGVAPGDLPGIEPVLQAAGVPRPPQAQRAVLVGTALSPGQVHRKPDGTAVRTLWGELAWQPYEPTAPATGQGEVANGGSTVILQAAAVPKRFFGTVALDPARVGRDAGRIAEEIIQHLAGLVGAKVEVTLDIHAEIPDGTPDHIVRTVTENCRTLRFKTHGFEET